MSFGFSIGDIILCARITHHVFTSLSKGRRQAPQDLKELQDALFGLSCALSILQKEYETVIARATAESSIALHWLEQIICSCQATLRELENATAQYRAAADDQANGPIRTQLRIQWRRILWSFRGDTFIKYRQKLQMHTDSLNLLLSAFLWSAAGRIEEDGRAHERRLNELVQRANEFNEEFKQSMRTLHATVQSADYQRHQIIGSRISLSLTS